jgi:hypothetical protein
MIRFFMVLSPFVAAKLVSPQIFGSIHLSEFCLTGLLFL